MIGRKVQRDPTTKKVVRNAATGKLRSSPSGVPCTCCGSPNPCGDVCAVHSDDCCTQVTFDGMGNPICAAGSDRAPSQWVLTWSGNNYNLSGTGGCVDQGGFGSELLPDLGSGDYGPFTLKSAQTNPPSGTVCGFDLSTLFDDGGTFGPSSVWWAHVTLPVPYYLYPAAVNDCTGSPCCTATCALIVLRRYYSPGTGGGLSPGDGSVNFRLRIYVIGDNTSCGYPNGEDPNAVIELYLIDDDGDCGANPDDPELGGGSFQCDQGGYLLTNGGTQIGNDSFCNNVMAVITACFGDASPDCPSSSGGGGALP